MRKHRFISALLAMLMLFSTSALTITSLAISDEAPVEYDPNMTIEEKWAWIQENNIQPAFSGKAESVTRSNSSGI